MTIYSRNTLYFYAIEGFKVLWSINLSFVACSLYKYKFVSETKTTKDRCNFLKVHNETDAPDFVNVNLCTHHKGKFL